MKYETMIKELKSKAIVQLSEEEVIRLIVNYALGNSNEVNDIVEKLLCNFSTVSSLLRISSTTLKELGIEESSQLLDFIVLLREFSIRASMLPVKTLLTRETVSQFAQMMLLKIGHLTTEVIEGLLFTKERRFIIVENMAIGSVNTAVFDTKTILDVIERHRAMYVILVHNHPSGICKPSSEDKETTKVIEKACLECGYSVLDHYIVTQREVYSMYYDQYIIKV